MINQSLSFVGCTVVGESLWVFHESKTERGARGRNTKKHKHPRAPRHETRALEHNSGRLMNAMSAGTLTDWREFTHLCAQLEVDRARLITHHKAGAPLECRHVT